MRFKRIDLILMALVFATPASAAQVEISEAWMRALTTGCSRRWLFHAQEHRQKRSDAHRRKLAGLRHAHAASEHEHERHEQHGRR